MKKQIQDDAGYRAHKRAKLRLKQVTEVHSPGIN